MLKKEATYLGKKEVVKSIASSSEYNLTSTNGSNTDVRPTLFLYYRPILLTALTNYSRRIEM